LPTGSFRPPQRLGRGEADFGNIIAEALAERRDGALGLHLAEACDCRQAYLDILVVEHRFEL